MPSIPLIVAAVVLTVILAIGFVAFQERSARGTKRRAKKGGKKFAFGLSLGAAGLAGVLEGFATGAAAGVGSVGAIVLSHPSFVVDLGLIGLGSLVVTNRLALSLPIFLFVSGGIIALGLALDET